MPKKMTKGRKGSAKTSRARSAAVLRVEAHRIVDAALTTEACEALANKVSIDDDPQARERFIADVKGALQDYFAARKNLDLEPMRLSQQRKLVEELLAVTLAFRHVTGMTEWEVGKRLPHEVWGKLRTAGFDNDVLRAQIIGLPVARFDRKNINALLADVAVFERVHGRIGLDSKDVLGRLMAALEGACRLLLGDNTLKDEGGRSTKFGERVAVCQLAAVHLRHLAVLAATSPESFTGDGEQKRRTESSRRNDFVGIARKERVDFIRAAMQTIGVSVTSRMVQKTIEAQEAANPSWAPRWFFDNRKELAEQV